MNIRLVARLLGTLILVIGLSLVFTLAWAIHEHEHPARGATLITMLVSLLLGSTLIYIGRRESTDRLYLREALAVVAVGWILAAVIGALPFILSGSIPDPIDAVFESMSGFTTTGSTILDNIEALPRSMLFWRSFTHWLGGIGIIVLFIAILPQMGVGAKHLFRSEIPGVSKVGVRPRVKGTAIFLIGVYSALTVAECLLLMAEGMTFFDALCHTFGTVATGGFSTRNASIAAFDSRAIDITIVIFMVLAGTNFSLYLLALRSKRSFKRFFQDTEWRAFVLVAAVVTIVIAIDLISHHTVEGYGEAFRESLFQTVSIETTTGYGTADFDRWPTLSRLLLILLMILGGCSGSTAGGLKVMRVIVIIRHAYHEVYRWFRPRTVKTIRVSGMTIKPDLVQSVMAYCILFVGLWAVGSVALASVGLDLVSAPTAALSALGNIGPGLGIVGPSHTYAEVPDPGKILLAGFMLLGRLEIFTLMVLFVPAFWKR